MPRRLLKRFMPTQEQLRRTRGLGFIGERLFDPDVWHLSRRSVRMAMLVGVFACWIPLPVQMPLACGLALLLRCNLPMAAALCWVSNPLTLPAMLYVGYKTGALLLGQSPLEMPDDISLDVLTEQLGAVGVPFLIGSLVCGIVTGLAAAMAIDLTWRYMVLRRWRQRLHAEGMDIWRQAFRARRSSRDGNGMASSLDVDIPDDLGPDVLDPDAPDTDAPNLRASSPNAGPAQDPAQRHAVRDRSRPQG